MESLDVTVGQRRFRDSFDRLALLGSSCRFEKKRSRLSRGGDVAHHEYATMKQFGGVGSVAVARFVWKGGSG